MHGSMHISANQVHSLGQRREDGGLDEGVDLGGGDVVGVRMVRPCRQALHLKGQQVLQVGHVHGLAADAGGDRGAAGAMQGLLALEAVGRCFLNGTRGERQETLCGLPQTKRQTLLHHQLNNPLTRTYPRHPHGERCRRARARAPR